jgi:hypothetical protein
MIFGERRVKAVLTMPLDPGARFGPHRRSTWSRELIALRQIQRVTTFVAGIIEYT